MRRTPVNDYLEDISTELPEEIYGYLSDAIYETVCEFDEKVDQLKAENAKLREQSERLFDKTLELAAKNDRLRELLDFALPIAMYAASAEEGDRIRELMREVEL